MYNKIVRRCAGVSLRTLWNLMRTPWKMRILLNPPVCLSNTAAARMLFPNATPQAIEDYRMELLRNDGFYLALNKNMTEKRHRWVLWDNWHEFLYIVARTMKPQIVVETGVFDGQSSAVILQALNDNHRGTLVSVDLPATVTIEGSTQAMRETTLPPDCRPGWIIPDYLRERHRLLQGDSKELLPQLLREYQPVDIFFHDSLHTCAHQYFEYTTVWPHMAAGGVFLSDDVTWSFAFHKFCRQKKKNYVQLENSGFGVMRK